MTARLNTLEQHIHPAGAGEGVARQVGRFVLHFLEMQILMVLGMIVFGMLTDQLRASPSFGAAFRAGADLAILGDGLFMSVPMVAWMLWRGHDRRHSLEMGAFMLVPGLAIIALGWLGADRYAPWLRDGACGFMCLGMSVYMFFRFGYFAGAAGHAAHATHRGR